MRLLELDLRRFGAFSDPGPIALPDGEGPGLCVLYGPNEVGKSTALRGIHALLYGIPARSPDNFRHPYPDLRVAGRVRFDDGEELAFTRRKRAKETLFDYADREPLATDRLDALAEAVPEALFRKFYGIDPAGLRAGAAALLQDEGEVGRALYGASLGVANLRAVIDQLDREALALFAPRARKASINAGLAEWKSLNRSRDDEALEPSAWSAQADRVAEAAEREAALEGEVTDLRRRVARAKRLKRSLPALAQRAESRARLAERAAVPPLPDDFAERLTAARAGRRAALDQRQRALDRIEREEEARAELSPDVALLEHAEPISALQERIGAYRDTVAQLPRREADVERVTADLAERVGGDGVLRPDQLEAWRSALRQETSVRSQVTAGERLEERLAAAREALDEARAECARLRDAAPESGIESDDPEAAAELERVLREVLALGPIEERQREAEDRRAEGDERVRALATRLGLDDEGESDPIEARRFPEAEWIDAELRRRDEHASKRARLAEERQRVEAARREVAEALRKTASAGALPEPRDLELRREARQAAWRAVREAAIDAPTPVALDARRAVAEAYEERVGAADGIADRLRADADRVAKRADLEARTVSLAEEAEALEARARGLTAEGEALEADWVSAWRAVGVTSDAPERMRAWRRELDLLLDARSRRREAEREVAARAREQAEAATALEAALAAVGVETEAGEAFRARVQRAQRWLRRAGEARAARVRIEEAEARIARQEREVERVSTEQGRWRVGWAATTAALGLGGEAPPVQALDRLAHLQEIVTLEGSRAERIARVESMVADRVAFEEAVASLVGRCAPDLAGRPAPDAAAALKRRLDEATDEQRRRRESEARAVEARAERDEAEAQLEACDAELEALCRLAGVEEEDALDAALDAWRVVVEDRRILRGAEQTLEELGEGASIATLEQEAKEVDGDALGAEIVALEERLDRATAAQKQAIAELQSERDRLDAMDGRARAAELAQAAESRLARVRRDVERYVELRLAKQLLEAEIERHRRENEAPLLASASRLFERLTRGNYARVTSELAEDGRTVQLVAVRRDESERSVSALSAGTRDQLFLALRLAALESSLGRRESMPLIADDLLIEFDDARTRATLETLAEVAEKNQILLLSHHLHVYEIAKEMGGSVHAVEL